eukprot:1509992-Prymnesium_polylepis.1
MPTCVTSGGVRSTKAQSDETMEEVSPTSFVARTETHRVSLCRVPNGGGKSNSRRVIGSSAIGCVGTASIGLTSHASCVVPTQAS